MNALIDPALEFLIFIPGLTAAYLPMKQHRKMSPGKITLCMLPLSLILALICSGLCYLLRIRALWLFFPAAALLCLFYVHTLDVTRRKSISVFLAICGSFSCLGGAADALNLALCPEQTSQFLSLQAALFLHLMCWGAVLLAWYPSTHATRDFLLDEAFAGTWYVFWILPAFFILLNLFLLSFLELFTHKRLLHIYFVLSFALLLLLFLFYAMFYHMASSLNCNSRLQLENQLLSMQQARHDNLCDNKAVDAVSACYGLLYQRHRIPFSMELDLPVVLPVPEVDLCLVLSNFLENALEASLRTGPDRRQVQVQACVRSPVMVLVTVSNPFDGSIKEKNGIFQSSKCRGEGIGTRSVRHIAEKSGGYCRFLHGNGTF